MLSIHKGDTRIVLAIPFLGIAIKIARVRWKSVAYEIKSIRRRARIENRFPGTECSLVSSVRKELFEYTVDTERTVRHALLFGLVSNWREFRFYWQCDAKRRQLLQPTYISLFGLVNIAKYGTPMKSRSLFDPNLGELYRCFWDVVGPAMNADAHLFHSETNFTYVNERLVRILDYGSLKTQEIVRNHGSVLLERFIAPDPSRY